MEEIEFNNKCKEYGFDKTEIFNGTYRLHKTNIKNIYITVYNETKDLIVLLFVAGQYRNKLAISLDVFNSEDDFKSVLNNFNEECKSHNK